jgi:hypothetical protein
MLPWENPWDIQIFNGMTEFYQRFITKFTFIMTPIAELMRKSKAHLNESSNVRMHGRQSNHGTLLPSF